MINRYAYLIPTNEGVGLVLNYLDQYAFDLSIDEREGRLFNIPTSEGNPNQTYIRVKIFGSRSISDNVSSRSISDNVSIQTTAKSPCDIDSGLIKLLELFCEKQR